MPFNREAVGKRYQRFNASRHQTLTFGAIVATQETYRYQILSLVNGALKNAHDICDHCSFHGRECTGVHDGDVTFHGKPETIVNKTPCNLGQLLKDKTG